MSRGINHETERAALLSQAELIGQRLEDWQGVGKLLVLHSDFLFGIAAGREYLDARVLYRDPHRRVRFVARGIREEKK